MKRNLQTFQLILLKWSTSRHFVIFNFKQISADSWSWQNICFASAFQLFSDINKTVKFHQDNNFTINFHQLSPLPSTRQHLSYGDCLEVQGILSEQLCAGLCDTMFTVCSTLMSSSYRSNRLGLSHWDPYTVRRGGCLELYYCNMVEWFWWDSSLIFDNQRVSFSALTLLVWSSGV